MNFGAKGTQSSELALEFTRALTRRDYRAAHSMTSREFQSRFSCEQMQKNFESIIPEDWGSVDPIEIGTTMDNWPTKGANDLEWVYVVLGGDVYSEAVVVVVSEEDGVLKIREVEWGHP